MNREELRGVHSGAKKLKKLLIEKVSNVGRPKAQRINCLNCGGPVDGSFCSNCGQRADTDQYTTKRVFKELASQFRRIDSVKTSRTFYELIVRPGVFVRNYLAGRRVDYTGPFQYFLYAFVLQVSAGFLIHWVTGKDVSLITANSDLSSQAVDIVATGFWGLGWWLVYRNSRLNIAENIVAAFYYTAQTFMFTLILRIAFGPFITWNKHVSEVLSYTDTTIDLLYSFHFAHRLFREKTWKLILKQLFLVIVYIVILLVILTAMTVSKRWLGLPT